MKKNQRGEAELVASIIMAAIALVIWAVLASWGCSSRWAKSDMQTSWGPVQGCLVKTPGGRWVPDDRVRDVDLEPRESNPAPEIQK